jgi:ankyrin repeat protein
MCESLPRVLGLKREDGLDVPQDKGWTPLSWAANEGNMENMKLLLEARANVYAVQIVSGGCDPALPCLASGVDPLFTLPLVRIVVD